MAGNPYRDSKGRFSSRGGGHYVRSDTHKRGHESRKDPWYPRKKARSTIRQKHLYRRSRKMRFPR